MFTDSPHYVFAGSSMTALKSEVVQAQGRAGCAGFLSRWLPSLFCIWAFHNVSFLTSLLNCKLCCIYQLVTFSSQPPLQTTELAGFVF